MSHYSSLRKEKRSTAEKFASLATRQSFYTFLREVSRRAIGVFSRPPHFRVTDRFASSSRRQIDHA